MSLRCPQLETVRALMRRGSTRSCACPGAAIPGVLAPTIFFLGLTAVFGNLTRLAGFGTDSYESWLVPVSLMQAAGFTGAATGVNLARDIEQGWFDRLLASPAPLLAPRRVRALGELSRPDPGDVPAHRRVLARRPLAPAWTACFSRS